MSVINQMLRDLDKQQGKVPAPTVAQPVFARAGKTAGWRWLLPLLLALLLLLQWQPLALSQGWRLVAAFWQPVADPITAKPDGPKPLGPKPVISEPPVLSEPVISEPVTTPAQITSVVVPMPVAPEPVLSEPVLAESVTTPEETTPAEITSVIAPIPVAPEANLSAVTDTPAALQWQPAPAIAASSLTIEQLPDSPELQLSQLQQRAEAAQASQQLLQATALWQQYLQLAPDRPRPYEQLAALWWQQQQWAELEQLLAQARARQIQSAQLQLQQARLAASQQQWALVLTLLSAGPMSELLTDVLPLQAQAQQQLGDYQAALGSYQQWSQLVPDSARAWLGLGLVYDQLNQTTAARAAYQQALALGGLAPASQQFIQQRLAQTE
jgi:hypothetical protein